MRICIAILLLALTGCQTLELPTTDKPIAYKTLIVGKSTTGDVLDYLDGRKFKHVDGVAEGHRQIWFQDTFAGRPLATVKLEFLDGTLFRVGASFENSDSETRRAVVRALEAKYGPSHCPPVPYIEPGVHYRLYSGNEGTTGLRLMDTRGGHLVIIVIDSALSGELDARRPASDDV